MRRNTSIVANPVLVGAVTTLVVVVAVFLAYNANNGLPFVPTRELNVEIANGANLVRGNEVRSGGYRVGVVEDMSPHRLENGKVGALLKLKLDKKIGAIPDDTRALIRPRSALGLKYVELTTGHSSRTLSDGGTLPVSHSKVEVDLDEFYNVFDKPTREGSRANLDTFGDAFSGRGADLAQTLRTAPSLFGHLTRVMAVLSAPNTELRRFFDALGRTAAVVAPVSAVNARLFTTMADTFGAIAKDPAALKATISKSPPTLDVGTRSLRVQRPFLEHTAALSSDLEAASTELRGALPTINRALAVGTPVTRRTVGLYDNLQGSMDALQRLVEAPTTIGALRGLTATVTTLQPQLRFLGPYVTVCNSWNFFWTLAAEHLSSPDSMGSEQRVLLNAGPPSGPTDSNDNVDSDNANEFAHGKVSQEPGAPEELLHNNFYGAAIDDQGNANCEAGQQGYVQSANPFRDRTIKGDPYRDVSVDHPINPDGLRVGPTYATIDRDGKGHGLNPDHVPAGQTFTARPGGLGALGDTPPLSSYPGGGR